MLPGSLSHFHRNKALKILCDAGNYLFHLVSKGTKDGVALSQIPSVFFSSKEKNTPQIFFCPPPFLFFFETRS